MRPTVYFTVDSIAPTADLSWNRVTAQGRRAFWEEAGNVGLEIKRKSLSRGLDRYGRKMAAIHKLTKQARDADINPVKGSMPYSPMGRADSTNAPLQATGGQSRTITLLTFGVSPSGAGVDFWWEDDSFTGRNWGDILARHAVGFMQQFVWPGHTIGHVKARNVIGMSPADTNAIEARMLAWWRRSKAQYMPMVQPIARPAIGINLRQVSLPGGGHEIMTAEEMRARGLGNRPHQLVGRQTFGPPPRTPPAAPKPAPMPKPAQPPPPATIPFPKAPPAKPAVPNPLRPTGTAGPTPPGPPKRGFPRVEPKRIPPPAKVERAMKLVEQMKQVRRRPAVWADMERSLTSLDWVAIAFVLGLGLLTAEEAISAVKAWFDETSSVVASR